MRWSEQDYDDFNRRRLDAPVDVSNPPFKLPGNGAGAFALGRLPVGSMNKTEVAYDTHLWGLRRNGTIVWHKFEGIKLRLADNTFYTSDFAVLTHSFVLELHEVKGFWQDDARVKIKVAAALYPFKFIAVTKKGDGWSREEF